MNGMYVFDKNGKVGYVVINQNTVTLSSQENITFKGYLYVNLDSNLDIESANIR